MSHEEMERAIEFLLGHQANLSTEVQSLTGAVKALTEDVHNLTGEMREGFNNLIAANDAMREEMREGFSKLILANEVTRDLALQIGKLAYNTSQRVTKLEQS